MRREGDQGMGEDRRTPSPPARSGLSGRWIAVIVAAVLLVIFAILNSERVTVDFLFFDAKARTVTVIVVAAALGFVIGYFVGRPSRTQRKALRG
jgi:uncharacterized integral membrane protein